MRSTRDGAGGLVLYAATLACELPAAWARAYLAYAVVWFYTETQSVSAGYRWPVALAVGFAPLAWSVAALVVPAASVWLWRHRVGGRAPSEQERLMVADALGDLRVDAPRWFVVDDVEPRAAVYGDALMLTRGMFAEPTLAAVLAHELGHLTTLDARLTAALDCIVIWRPGEDGRGRGLLRALLRGGLGLRLLRIAWATWWREREHRADAYASALGRGDELAAHLELHALLHDRPVPFMWASGETHPPTAHRIERLQQRA